MKNLVQIIVIFFIGSLAYSQQGDGTIMGTVFGSDSTTVQPFADVWIDYKGSPFSVKTDLNGKFKIDPVAPGVYNLHARQNLVGSANIAGIRVNPESITKYNIYFGDNMMDTIEVVWTEPMLKDDHISTITLTDIKHNPNIQSPKTMIAGMNSDVKLNSNNQLIIRGSRPGDVVYFVDGVKQTNLQTVPGVAINSMSVYTGGVPAKYGDTTGGVVIIETKSYFDLYNAWKGRQ